MVELDFEWMQLAAETLLLTMKKPHFYEAICFRS